MKPLNIKLNNKAGSAAIVLLLMLGMLSGSCKKELYEEIGVAQETPLQLNVDESPQVLNEKEAFSKKVEISWTSGTNKGTNSAITYTLEIDKQGNNFASAIVENLGKGELSKEYTVKQLNDMLIDHWKVAPGEEVSLEARVKTQVAGHPDLSEVSTAVLKVTAYKPVSTTLFIIGSSAPNGWDAGKAEPLKLSQSSPGKFTWTGRLNSGEFKFITTLGQFSPSYNKGSDNTKLFYRTSDSQPDDKFVIAESGKYNIEVNLLDLSINITKAAGPPYEKLWIVGSATPNGWNIDNPNEMRVDASNPFVFHYNAVLNAGEFKIPTSTGNWGTDYYMPPTNAPDLSSTAVELIKGGSPDNKWQITNPGPYKITLDLEKMTISIKPFTPYTEVWMVGDATPAGWDINNPHPMTATPGNPYEFSYTGPMSAGEFKLPLAKGDWATNYFMPEVDQEGAGSSYMKFVEGGSPDHKWRITEAGNYRIVINQLTMAISIQKL